MSVLDSYRKSECLYKIPFSSMDWAISDEIIGNKDGILFRDEYGDYIYLIGCIDKIFEANATVKRIVQFSERYNIGSYSLLGKEGVSLNKYFSNNVYQKVIDALIQYTGGIYGNALMFSGKNMFLMEYRYSDISSYL